MEPLIDTADRARVLVQALRAGGFSSADIAARLGGSVSVRTVYRWQKGDSGPQRGSDLASLERLAQEVENG
jgi:transposase